MTMQSNDLTMAAGYVVELERLKSAYEIQMRKTDAAEAECERLRAALTRILATAPWSDEDGHGQCIKEARMALAHEQNVSGEVK